MPDRKTNHLPQQLPVLLKRVKGKGKERERREITKIPNQQNKNANRSGDYALAVCRLYACLV